MKNKNVIIRTQSAGVFAGVLKSRKGSEVTLTDARRLWYWSGGLTFPTRGGRGEQPHGV